MATHRKPGHVGSFTVHAPADYRPRHAAHVEEHEPEPKPRPLLEVLEEYMMKREEERS